MIYVIDLFCGAGGTTSGAHLAGAKVIACVNHDENALASHEANHPGAKHFPEDIRSAGVIEKLRVLVEGVRSDDPDAVILLWASLECTNYSNAKGGLPRDPDSRSLANYMPRYIEAIEPEIFAVENVREFLAWGPLDKHQKPVSRTAGKDFVRWYSDIKKMGYDAEYRILNSANFGACQSRERLFIQFSKVGIFWPKQTHVENTGGLFGHTMKKWRPVRDALDLHDRGRSIFERKKPLVEATLARIYAGLVKFTDNDAFMVKNFSGEPEYKVSGLDAPSGTVTCIDNKSLVFLQYYNGNGGVVPVSGPSPTVTTNDRLACVFVDQQYGKSKPRSVNVPSGTITTTPKLNLVHAEFLVNPQYKSAGSSVDRPSPTLIARMDKAPLSLATTFAGSKHHKILPTDSPTTVKIKRFMITRRIGDITMRMLKIVELKLIQGFPPDYVLVGTQGEQKKFIGNAVEVRMAKALFVAMRQCVDASMILAVG